VGFRGVCNAIIQKRGVIYANREESDPEGNAAVTAKDLVSDGVWRLYRLDFAGLPGGRFTVAGTLNDIAAFDKAFFVSP